MNRPHYTVGVDECGTGAWAGPIAVTALAVPAGWQPHRSVRDSKAFVAGTGRERYELRLACLRQHVLPHAVAYSTQLAYLGDVSQTQAWVSAAQFVLVQVFIKLGQLHEEFTVNVVIDGVRRSGFKFEHARCEPPVWLPRADALVPAVSAASIEAKCARDAHMLELDRVYPRYRFAQHMGYGTPAHRNALIAHGATEVHRSFVAEKLERRELAARG